MEQETLIQTAKEKLTLKLQEAANYVDQLIREAEAAISTGKP